MSSPKTFADFALDDSIVSSLADVGITEPFPIQEMTLPLALTGADIIGQARTGTGKTLGFGLPMLQRIDTNGDLQALIIVPTRELCLQVAEDLTQAGKGRGVKVLAVYGGKAIQPQIDALTDGVHLVVGTPGRLLDLGRRGVMNLATCTGLVLDEADEMLDLGFLPDVESLVDMCSDDRQTLLFSATMPSEIVGLARRYMTKPTFMRAEVEEITIAPQTKQYFFNCHRMDKPAVLARILQTPDRGLCVVFCRTKRMADTLAEELRDRDISAKAIHSDLRQEARERALQKFREGSTTVLCATEVAARGLDIDDVSHVVNYDCPDDHKMYLHRIGRTGRAGAKGVAITFVTYNEIPRLEMIRRDLEIDEEIIEVFSTSPELEEMFDLPPLEKKKKVPSPPQARRGQSRRNTKSSDDSRRGKKGSSNRTEHSADGQRQRKSTQNKSTQSTQNKSTQNRTAEGKSSERSASGRKSEDSGARTRTRTRTRTKSVEDSPDTPTGTSGRSRERSGKDKGGRDDSRKTDRSTGKSDSSGRDSNGTDNQKRNRNGGQKSDQSSDRKSDQNSGQGRDRKSDRNRNRDGQKKSNDQRGKSGGGSSRGGQGSSRNKDARRTRGNESDRQSRRRTVIDSQVARGDGTPRLDRKMDVQHLP